MIDYHCHVLPEVDDGASSVQESLAMLRQSYHHGVKIMVSTSHFYPDEEEPKAFLSRRNAAYLRLKEAMKQKGEPFPLIVLGAEVLYFPGISQAEEIASLAIGCRTTILVEPPMVRWSDRMLDEIVELGQNLKCRPVIAHVDRYMSYLGDGKLIDRVLERNLLVQVNGAYFLDPKTVKFAVRNLKRGKIHLIGSDCHNMSSRRPNLGEVRALMKTYRAESEFQILERNARKLLFPGDYL